MVKLIVLAKVCEVQKEKKMQHRPVSRYQTVRFDSKLKQNGQTNTDFEVVFNNSRLSQDRIVHVEILNMDFVNLFGNVTGYYGNSLVVNGQVIVLPAGQYSQSQLIAALLTEINAAFPLANAVITVQPINGTWVLQSDIDLTITSQSEERGELLRTIGLDPAGVYGPTQSLVFGSPPYLNRPSVVKVYTNLKDDQCTESKNNGETTALMEVVSLGNVEYGQGLTYQRRDDPSTGRVHYMHERQLDKIRVELKDKYDMPLTLPENATVGLTARVGVI